MNQFVKKAARLLPISGESADNVCGLQRRVSAAVYPSRVRDVRALVKLARQEGQPLYPLSQGKSWGLGSRLPVEEGHVVVDLSRMRKIRWVDDGVVKIQAGVTQGDLARFLWGTPWVMNVTGSARESSIVGNALDRGVAHYGCRASEILGLDVVLGTGKVLRAGRASYGNGSYPYGLGADLRGLFFQSNFGIVTSACVRLRPRPDVVSVVSVEKAPDVSLEEFVDGLRRFRGNLHISNRERRLSVLTPLVARQRGVGISEVGDLIAGDWAALSSVEGGAPDVSGLERLGRVAVRRSDEEPNGELALATRGIFGHSCGEPCDDAIPSLGYQRGEAIGSDPVASSTGVLFLVPLLRMRGSDVAEVASLVEDEFGREGFVPLMTFNLCEGNLEGVVNLTFDRRNPERVKAAHRAVETAFGRLFEAGYPPQRMSIFQQGTIEHPDRSHARVVRELKKLFDPDDIIARGRYEF